MALLFGLSFVATKFALRALPPFTLIFVRFFLASLILWAVFRRKRESRIRREDRRRMFLASLIVPGLYFLGETYGLKLSSATTVSMLISSIPIHAALFGLILLGERIPFWRAAGILLSIAGVAIILSAGAGENGAWEMAWSGNLLAIGAAVCAGLYMAIARDLTTRYSPLAVTTFQSLFTVVLFFPLTIMELFTSFTWEHLGVSTALAVIYLALFCSVLAFFLWNYGISRLEAGKAAVFTNLVPVFTVIGATLFLGEKIQLEQVLGGVLVICGVSLASMGRGAERTKL